MLCADELAEKAVSKVPDKKLNIEDFQAQGSY
jgi:hypothetical protein